MSEENIIRIYNIWAKYPSIYKAMVTTGLLTQERKLRMKTAKYLTEKGPGDYFEAFCGPGVNYKFLMSTQYGPLSNWLFNDSNKKMIHHFKKLLPSEASNIGFMPGDIRKLSFQNHLFDGILCTLGLSLLDDPNEVMQLLYKKLKKGGRIVIFDVRTFPGNWSLLNHLILPFLSRISGWNLEKNVDEVICANFHVQHVEYFFKKSAFILVIEKA